MPNEHDQRDAAEYLYSEGKKYDWQQDISPAAAVLARANFKQAAQMGHRGAVRALALLVYEGRGGAQDREAGLLMLWSAFSGGDNESLEELGDLLASYAEQCPELSESKRAAAISKTIEEIGVGLRSVSSFMHGLSLARSQ